MYKHTRGKSVSRPSRAKDSTLGTQFSVATSRAKRNFAKKIKLRTNINLPDEPNTSWFVIWGVGICFLVTLAVFLLVSMIRSSVSYADPQEAYLKEFYKSGGASADIEHLPSSKKIEDLVNNWESAKKKGNLEGQSPKHEKSDDEQSTTSDEKASTHDSASPPEADVGQASKSKGNLASNKEAREDLSKKDQRWDELAKLVASSYSKLCDKFKSSTDTSMKHQPLFDLDLMKLMGLDERFRKTRKDLTADDTILLSGEISVFEASVKVLGGLLAAFEMSQRTDTMLLKIATQFGDKLLGAWQGGNVFPRSIIDLSSGATKSNQNLLLSEVGAIQLEFSALSTYSGDSKYQKRVQDISPRLKELAAKTDGLYPKFIDPRTESFQAGAQVTVGSMADAFFQNLLKSWIYSGYSDTESLKQFLDAADAIESKLVQRVKQPGRIPEMYTFFAEYNTGRLSRVMEEFACYYPGLLSEAILHANIIFSKPNFQANKAEELLLEHKERFKALATKLLDSCFQLYKQGPEGLAAEAITFTKESWTVMRPHRQHRPETLKSLYYMASITNLDAEKKKYKQMGQEIFEAMIKFDQKAEKLGEESKMMLQTLRYAYLLFAEENLIDHTKTVLTTEGHPLAINKVT